MQGPESRARSSFLYLLASADVVALAPGALTAGCDENEERVAVEDLVRPLAGDRFGQLLVGEPTAALARLTWASGGAFRHQSGPSEEEKYPDTCCLDTPVRTPKRHWTSVDGPGP